MAESIDPKITAHVADLTGAARRASRRLGLLSRAEKDAALLAMADALGSASAQIIAANDEDIARGRAQSLADGLIDRLRLDQSRVSAVAEALRDIAGLPDPVGEVVRGSTLANGLQIRQVRVPMGVVAMIYEARPNVTVDAASLPLKSGNAVVGHQPAALGRGCRVPDLFRAWPDRGADRHVAERGAERSPSFGDNLGIIGRPEYQVLESRLLQETTQERS